MRCHCPKTNNNNNNNKRAKRCLTMQLIPPRNNYENSKLSLRAIICEFLMSEPDPAKPGKIRSGNCTTPSTKSAKTSPSGHNNGQKGADLHRGTTNVP